MDLFWLTRPVQIRGVRESRKDFTNALLGQLKMTLRMVKKKMMMMMTMMTVMTMMTMTTMTNTWPICVASPSSSLLSRSASLFLFSTTAVQFVITFTLTINIFNIIIIQRFFSEHPQNTSSPLSRPFKSPRPLEKHPSSHGDEYILIKTGIIKKTHLCKQFSSWTWRVSSARTHFQGGFPTLPCCQEHQHYLHHRKKSSPLRSSILNPQKNKVDTINIIITINTIITIIMIIITCHQDCRGVHQQGSWGRAHCNVLRTPSPPSPPTTWSVNIGSAWSGCWWVMLIRCGFFSPEVHWTLLCILLICSPYDQPAVTLCDCFLSEAAILDVLREAPWRLASPLFGHCPNSD